MLQTNYQEIHFSNSLPSFLPAHKGLQYTPSGQLNISSGAFSAVVKPAQYDASFPWLSQAQEVCQGEGCIAVSEECLDLPWQCNHFQETIASWFSLTAPNLLWFLPAMDSALHLVKAMQWLTAELGTSREAVERRKCCNFQLQVGLPYFCCNSSVADTVIPRMNVVLIRGAWRGRSKADTRT